MASRTHLSMRFYAIWALPPASLAGVTTCVCVSTTIRGGVEYNYRMIVVGDAVAEVDRITHEAELRTMARIFADVKTTDEVVGMLDQCQGR